MYGLRYFAKHYFAGRFFPPVPSTGGGGGGTGTATQYGYFLHKSFNARYFANRYFPGAGYGTTTTPPSDVSQNYVIFRRRRR